MILAMQCPYCHWTTGGYEGMVIGSYVVHVIDDHWDLVERMRATTGKPEARQALVDELSGRK